MSVVGMPWTVRGQCVSEQAVVVVAVAVVAVATGPAANIAAGTTRLADSTAMESRPLRPRRRVRFRTSNSFLPDSAVSTEPETGG